MLLIFLNLKATVLLAAMSFIAIMISGVLFSIPLALHKFNPVELTKKVHGMQEKASNKEIISAIPCVL